MSIFGKLFGRKPSATPGLQALMERYAQAASARFPGVRPVIALAATAAESSVVLHFPEGSQFTQFFGNVWPRCQAGPEAVDEVFAEQFASIERVRREWEDDANREPGLILPVLKSRGWHDASLQQLRDAGVAVGDAPFVVRPFVGDLVMTFVEDRPESMNYIGAKSARERGLDDEALFAHALENLAGLLPQLRIEGGGGRHVARLDRNYDASMALLFDRWRDRVDVPGEPVLAIAARDELLIGGTGDIKTLLQLQQIAGEIVEQSAYALTSRLFVFRNGRLAPLMIARKDDDVVLVDLAADERIGGGTA